MAKRRTNRKVIIRFVGREPEDSVRLLSDVDTVFRPQEIEITVERSEKPPDTVTIPNEVLETRTREAVSETLDKKAEAIREKERNPSRNVRSPIEEHTEVDDATIVGTSTDVRKRTLSWLSQVLKSGWSLISKVVPVVKSIKDIIE